MRGFTVTDMFSAFHQIEMDCASMKYCTVVMPFCSASVYRWCAMGMSGSKTTLEELLCLMLGHLNKDCKVAKIADL